MGDIETSTIADKTISKTEMNTKNNTSFIILLKFESFIWYFIVATEISPPARPATK